MIDEMHEYKKYVDQLIDECDYDSDNVSVFYSAIELCPWVGDGYEFLFAFAEAATKRYKQTLEDIVQEYEAQKTGYNSAHRLYDLAKQVLEKESK